MSAVSPAVAAPSPLTHMGWALKDTWIIARRDLNHWLLQPAPVVIGWAFPLMVVLMFGGLFGGALSVVTEANYFDVLMPGMFALTMLFGLETTITAVTTDAARGVTDRFRSLPMSSAAVVGGRCVADMLNTIVGLAILLAAGLLLGWRWYGSLSAALAAIGLLLLLRFGLLWVGVYIGLIAKGPESVTSVQILVWPIGFLSNVFVDPATMPAWLGMLAEWNPLSATAAATRELFGHPGADGSSWIAQHAILMAVVWPVVLVVIFGPLSARTFRNLAR